jgi:hypothetical protein
LEVRTLPYVRVWFSDEVWAAVKRLAKKELRRPACQVTILVQQALRELQQEEARRPSFAGPEAAGPAEHQSQSGGETDAPTTQ